MFTSTTTTTSGKFIRSIRDEYGLSQAALGEPLGKTRQMVSLWESDQFQPDVDKVGEWCTSDDPDHPWIQELGLGLFRIRHKNALFVLLKRAVTL